MIYLKVLLTTLLSFVALLIITKLIGYRQMSQMSMFDYINGITIGSIAAELATSLESDWLLPLEAMLLYGLFVVGISLLTSHSLFLRKHITGKPLTMYRHGRLFYDSFKKSKVDVNEFLMQCRNKGYFDLSQVDTVILEPNGRLSIMPKAAERPLTPTDMKIAVSPSYIPVEVIIDGNIMYGNLAAVGRSTEWLLSELKCGGAESPEQVFLAMYTPDGKLNIYKKETQKEAKSNS
ncbi:MAG: DUF421 domain-containing protein [Eubacteriales bacterium]